MTNEKNSGDEKKQTSSEKQEPQSSVTKKTTPMPKTAKKPMRLVDKLLYVVVLVLLLSIAIGGYFAWQFWQTQNVRIENISAQLENQSTMTTTAMSQQSRLLEKQKQQLAQFQSTIDNHQKVLQQRLDTHANRLNTLSGSSRDNWMLEEARYLLRLANQRQLTGGSALGIVGLLESADALLREFDEPDLFSIRDSISKSILALKIAPSIDREGIYLQLSALLDQIDALPPVPLTSAIEQSATVTAEPETVTAVGSHWQDGLWESVKGAFSHLDQYFRINHHKQALEPLLSANQQQVMAQNLRLMLEQAQIALLREEEKIYQHSLEKVIQWLHVHYSHYPEKQALVDQIIRLQQQTIKTILPRVNAPLSQLSDYIQNNPHLSPSKNNTGQGVSS